MPFFRRDTTKQTVTKLREKVEQLEKKEEFDRKRMDNEMAKAKEAMKAGNKTLASQHLKRKKMYEKNMNESIQMRMNIEGQILEIESAKTKADTAKSFQTANKEMTKLNKQMDAAKIEKTMDDLRENNEKAREVGELLGEDLIDMDMGELEDELADLEDEVMDEMDQELADLEDDLPKPKAQKQKVAKAKTLAQEEEDELAELM